MSIVSYITGVLKRPARPEEPVILTEDLREYYSMEWFRAGRPHLGPGTPEDPYSKSRLIALPDGNWLMPNIRQRQLMDQWAVLDRAYSKQPQANGQPQYGWALVDFP